MKNDLAEILSAFSSQTLNFIVSYRGLSIPQKNKVAVVAALTNFFQDPRQIKDTEAMLAPAHRAVVNLILQQDGEASLTVIRKHLLRANLIDIKDRNDYSSKYHSPDHKATHSRHLEDIMANLLARGLVFARRENPAGNTSTVLDFSLSDVYIIPDTIRKHLKPPPAEPPWSPEAAKPPARINESSARSFQRDLYLYWSYIRQNQVELTAKGLIPKRHLVALNNSLLVREEIKTGQGEDSFNRLLFMRAVLVTLDLLEESGRLLIAKSDASFFSLDPLKRIRITLDTYKNIQGMNEIQWLHRITSYYQPIVPAPKFLLAARQAILTELKPLKGWIKLASLVKRMEDHNYEFLFPRRLNSSSYYKPIVYNGNVNPAGWDFPGIFSDDDGWNKIEANLIRTTICEFLFWMGLVDLGHSHPESEDSDVFRLTAAGEWLLAGGSPPKIPQESGQVVVQPDFTITAFDPVSDAVLHQLEQFSQRISAERAVVFRLTQQSVYTGQKNDWQADRIQSTLESLTGQPLPQNVARSLNEWQIWHERIRIRPDLIILQAADPQDLLLLSRDEELSPWLTEQPVPGTSILPSNLDPHQLLSLLAKQMWLPEVIYSETGLPSRSIEVHPDGRLTYLALVPNLYLTSFLARFAEAEDNLYRITRASVRKAIASKMTAPEILKELAKVAAGPIPPELEKKILAWSGHFGHAHLEEALLLRFKDEKTLKDLLQDPDLQEMLRPLQPSEVKVTVKIKLSDRQRLLQLLEERGIDLHS
jgi:hypothetical protein